jgi:hypothetical protein
VYKLKVEELEGRVGPVILGLRLGLGFLLWARAFVGLAWLGLQAWGLDCGLSPKTRPAWTRAVGLCSKSPNRP